MTIEELKRALVEVSEFCADQRSCRECPLSWHRDYPPFYLCRLQDSKSPMYWDVACWDKEDSNETD